MLAWKGRERPFVKDAYRVDGVVGWIDGGDGGQLNAWRRCKKANCSQLVTGMPAKLSEEGWLWAMLLHTLCINYFWLKT